MNSLKKELKTVIENQKNFNYEISGMKDRIEALENKKDINEQVQIDNLLEGIQFQKDVIQSKLSQIDASIKKIDEELETLTTRVFESNDVVDNADAENTRNSQVMCTECSFSSMQTCDMNKHVKAKHGKLCQKKCKVCGKSFMENHELEAHLKTHNEMQPFSCDKCEKKFYLKWRLEKHRGSHYTKKLCHYYNNQKACPYEDIGCMFRHEVSSLCRFSTCNNILCQYRHDENDLVTEDTTVVEDDSEILQRSTPMKYYPDCEDCTDNSNCVKCIIRNIRETDDSY